MKKVRSSCSIEDVDRKELRMTSMEEKRKRKGKGKRKKNKDKNGGNKEDITDRIPKEKRNKDKK
jgi:hypothetical protein